MVKLRIWGTSKEIDKTLDLLRKLSSNGKIELLSVSGKYADRGESSYCRTYCEIIVKDGGKT